MSWVGPIGRARIGDYSEINGEKEDEPEPGAAAPGPWFEFRWLCLREPSSECEIAVKLYANSRSTRFEGCVLLYVWPILLPLGITLVVSGCFSRAG